MMPIIGRYGPFFLTGYFVVLALGALLALLLTAVLARQRRLSGWLDGVLIGAIAALLAGRVVYVWLNPAYFAENPGQAWQFWTGGLNFQAALLGGLTATAVWARLTHRPLGATLDLLAPGLAVLVAAGWAACWFEGCAYGREGVPGLLTAALPDDFGVIAVRYRTQAAGVLLSAAVAAGAGWWAARHPHARWPGLLFSLTLAALAGIHALVSAFRGDPTPLWLGLRADVIVDLVIAAGALLAAAVLPATPSRQSEPC